MNFSFNAKTCMKWSRAAGTKLVYKVQQVVNISSSGFGRNICDLFSPRPEMPFVCHGRIVLESFFSFIPSLALLSFFCIFNTSISSYPLGTSEDKKWEACEGSWEDSQRFLSDISREGGMSFFAFFSIWPLKQQLSFCCLVPGGHISCCV